MNEKSFFILEILFSECNLIRKLKDFWWWKMVFIQLNSCLRFTFLTWTLLWYLIWGFWTFLLRVFGYLADLIIWMFFWCTGFWLFGVIKKEFMKIEEIFNRRKAILNKNCQKIAFKRTFNCNKTNQKLISRSKCSKNTFLWQNCKKNRSIKNTISKHLKYSAK